MRRLIKIFTTPTAKSSAVFYFGSFALGVGRYFFHLVLLRLLAPAEYGEFLAYLSLLYLLGIPNSTIKNIVTKFSAEFIAKKDYASANRLFYLLIRKLGPFTIAFAALLIISNQILANILKAHPAAFIVLGFGIIFGLFSTILSSYLNALHRFIALTVIGAIEITNTILLAVILIKLNFSATGAVSAQLLAGVVSLIIMITLVRHLIFPPQTGPVKTKLGSFAGYSLIFAIGSLSLISVDVLLVRYFMSQFLSGIYSSLSVIGRTVYFALGPLIALLLPIAARRYAATNSARSVFVKLGAVVVLFGLFIVGVFTAFPKVIVNLISASYLEAANYLPLFALAMFLYTLNIFIINYFMAIGKPYVNKLLLIAAAAQPILIVAFHQSLDQVVLVNLVVQIGLFLPLVWRLKLVI